ncbi:hypothetical protein ACVIGB_001015 [Bradyrhizobium sp. USDA 4341]
MVLLDNVVSEAMKPDPHPSVRDDALAGETLFFSSVNNRRTVVRHRRSSRRVLIKSPLRLRVNGTPRIDVKARLDE